MAHYIITSPIQTVIVSHVDVGKNTFTRQIYKAEIKLLDSVYSRFIHDGEASSAIIQTWERAAFMVSSHDCLR